MSPFADIFLKKRSPTLMIKNEIVKVVNFHTIGQRSHWNIQEISEIMRTIFSTSEDIFQKLVEIKKNSLTDEEVREKIINYLQNLALNVYENKEKEIGIKEMRIIEKEIYLRTIDFFWMEHLEAIENVRQGIGLRGYGQRDPLIEYKKEVYQMFERLLDEIQTKVVTTIYKIDIVRKISSPIENKNVKFSGGDETAGSMRIQPSSSQRTNLQTASRMINKKQKIGRNDPCPCGSGKKYKYCCGK